MSREQIDAFVAEYRPLCEKHGLVVSFDDGYVARELLRLPDDMDWDFYASAGNG